MKQLCVVRFFIIIIIIIIIVIIIWLLCRKWYKHTNIDSFSSSILIYLHRTLYFYVCRLHPIEDWSSFLQWKCMERKKTIKNKHFWANYNDKDGKRFRISSAILDDNFCPKLTYVVFSSQAGHFKSMNIFACKMKREREEKNDWSLAEWSNNN